MPSVRVLNFTPSVNGLHFPNSWPDVPDYTLNILGQTVKIGSASNGLCGGMAYTVRDLFQAGLMPPADTANPAGGSPAFNYIVARLTDSFDYDDVNQYLSWIQMTDGDDPILGHGLAWHEITEEWPNIKADLDSNLLCPLGLVHGQEPPVVGAITGLQDLGNCHQVLAWGYDLNGTSLTIHIYNPNYPGEDDCITLDIGNPSKATSLNVTHEGGFYRGFFRTHYTFHDPRTTASGSFIGTVVSSPGFPNGGPIQSPSVTRNWLSASGNPLVRFTGSVHDWSGNVSALPGDAGKLIHTLNLTIQTGGDDLRGGSGPNDNCDVIVKFASGQTSTIKNINGGQNWKNNDIHTVPLPLPAGTKSGDIASVDLHTQFGGGMGGDNWNVNQVSLQAILQ